MSLQIALFLFTFLFQWTLAADKLELAPHYIPTEEQAHQSVLEGFRDYHIKKYRSPLSTLTMTKGYHGKQALAYQQHINIIDPNQIFHEHVITYKDGKVQSVERKEGFIKKNDASLLGATHNFQSIYPSNETKSPTRPHSSPSQSSSPPVTKGKEITSSSTPSMPNQKMRRTPIPVTVHVKAKTTNNTPQQAKKAIKKIT